MKKLRITVGQNVYEVSVEEIDGGTIAGAPAPAPAPARVAPASSGTAPAAAPAPKPASGPAGSGDVPSPLAGKVVSVDVAVGATVAEGDRIATIEAMKMNTYLFAPCGGKVVSISVAAGDAVEEGQVIARIE
jgi:biotin carboxyl carrier protein